jgi:hypothetical protein
MALALEPVGNSGVARSACVVSLENGQRGCCSRAPNALRARQDNAQRPTRRIDGGLGWLLVRCSSQGWVKDLAAGSGLQFEDRGDHPLKGIPDAWRLFAVVAN